MSDPAIDARIRKLGLCRASSGKRQVAPIPTAVLVRLYAQVLDFERAFAVSVGPDAYFESLRELGYEVKTT